MGYAEDDAKEIAVILVLAFVFGWLFASVLDLYLIGLTIAVLMIVALFIFQVVRGAHRNKKLNQNFRPDKYDSEKA